MERAGEALEESHEIRLRHKRLRDEMSGEEAKEAGRAICESLILADWYPDCVWIYGYYPIGREVDCRSFLRQALSDGKRVALPRTEKAYKTERESSHAMEYRMDFFEITSLAQVTEGNFGVPEPDMECPLVEEERAVALVPGVVFDRTGNRYGYGKGYYDRYFARFPKLYKFGLSYEHQLEKKLFVSKTDVKMDGIYTERQCYLPAERTGVTHGVTGNL